MNRAISDYSSLLASTENLSILQRKYSILVSLKRSRSKLIYVYLLGCYLNNSERSFHGTQARRKHELLTFSVAS